MPRVWKFGSGGLLPHHQISGSVGRLLGSMTWPCRQDLADGLEAEHPWKGLITLKSQVLGVSA